jgi:outer membrane protein
MLASLGLALGAAVASVQAAAQQPASPPAQAPQPATPPAAPAAPAAVPFPAGAKFAYVNLPLLTSLTSDGKAAAGAFQAEQKKKVAEAEAKAKKMQADRQRLETGGGVMSPEARTTLEKDIERQQREGERYEQDAQAELNELQQKLQAEYNRKLFPVLEQMAKERGLQLLFSAADAGLIWAEPGLDLTQEAAKRMDAAPTPKPAAAPPPAQAKPATPARPTTPPIKP